MAKDERKDLKSEELSGAPVGGRGARKGGVLSFKGRGGGLSVKFEGGIFPSVAEIRREFRDTGGASSNRQIVMDFADLEISRERLQMLLIDVVFPLSLSIAQWTGTNEKTLETLASLGLRTDSPRPVINRGSLKIVTAPLRSGVALRHDGDVLLLGNLHSGAEISATGSIVVWGALLGQVHAGCAGSDDACVIAADYRTNQLRIGNLISNAMEPGPWWGKPVRIFISSGVFVAEELPPPARV